MKKTKQFELAFHSVRNISSPEDTQQGRKVFSGHIPAAAILNLPTDQNVRDYLVEAEGKKVRRLTSVHREIQETLERRPENFCVLNGGVVIVARDCEIDEKRKLLLLDNPSIVNGSQTQGVIKDFLEKDPEQSGFHSKYELIVTDDEELIADISISRNYQNDVLTISIAGRRGQLDELSAVMEKAGYPGLRKKESQYAGEDYGDTEKLLQVLAAMVPLSLSGTGSREYAYNKKTRCLKEFQQTHEAAKETRNPDGKKARDLYRFYLDAAPTAWQMYQLWKSHAAFKGSALRSIIRDGLEVVEVPDGIIFPILAALSVFWEFRGNRWVLHAEAQSEDLAKVLVEAAKAAYMQIAFSKPNIMGKNAACYSSLFQMTSLYRRLSSKVPRTVS